MLQVTAAALLLLFVQCQAADVKVMEHFDMDKYLGTWYGAMAVSDCKMFNEMKKDMTRPSMIYSKDGHDMKCKISFKTPKGCQEMTATLTPLGNGHYKHSSDHGENEIFISNTDYKSTAIEVVKLMHEGKTCTTVKVFRRTQDLPDDVKKGALDLMHAMGFKDADILTFTSAADCVPK